MGIRSGATTPGGHRLLVAGNGGSAAQAQHLSAELVGRFGHDRRPFAAVALPADTSSVTGIGNDYGFEEIFARQVTAHARPADVLMVLSTSGRSANLVRAVQVAGATTWAMTGERPNPLAAATDETLALSGSTASVQEAQLVAVHALCAMFDAALGTAEPWQCVS
ncbi:hypothetical protein GCM10029964_054110 [Kibdelosporangium lantanae]